MRTEVRSYMRGSEVGRVTEAKARICGTLADILMCLDGASIIGDQMAISGIPWSQSGSVLYGGLSVGYGGSLLSKVDGRRAMSRLLPKLRSRNSGFLRPKTDFALLDVGRAGSRAATKSTTMYATQTAIAEERRHGVCPRAANNFRDPRGDAIKPRQRARSSETE